MSYVQYLEEIQHSESARHERFDGFDRGDLDNDDDTGTFVIARQHTSKGRLILECSYCGGDEAFMLYFLDAATGMIDVQYAGDDKFEARSMGRALVLANPV